MLILRVIDEGCDDAIYEISQGNTDALTVIYRAYGKMIYSVGYQIVQNCSDAEDVLQDVMLNVVKYAHTYRRGTNPKAWIMSITRSCALSVIKKRGDAISIDNAEHLLPAEHEDIDKMLAIREAMNRLDGDERTILNFKLHIGLSHKEIASVLGINIFAVQKQYQRALAKFKKYYEE